MKDHSKKILIIGINYSPEITGIGRYSGEMGEWLSHNGFYCSVITSFPYYPNWKIQKPYSGSFYKKEIINDGKTTLYRCPFYVPANPSGLKRILHEASFFVSSFFLTTYLLFKPKHDYIFCLAPPFHLGFLALYYRFFKNGKIIYHVQDLQIDAAKDLKIIKVKFIFKVLFAFEKWILKRVNFISTISKGMQEKIKSKTAGTIQLFPNWVDTESYFPIKDKSNLKSVWGFKTTDKIILYSGSIGEKQGLESLVDIAIKCMHMPQLKFIICGNGPYKQNLKLLSIEKGASNISFLSLQAAEVFNDFLNFADVHLVLQKKEASDLVMPSKLTTILSTGGLVIATAQPGTSLFNEITENNMGIVIPPENSESLYTAIILACSKEFEVEKTNARSYAEKYLNKEIIMTKMKATIMQ